MEKYIINSVCIAMTNNAVSFNVELKDYEGNILSGGNVLINSNYRSDCCVSFHCSDSLHNELKNEIVEHCIRRAYTVFQPNMDLGKEQET